MATTAAQYLETEFGGAILRMSRARRVPGLEPDDLRQEAAVKLMEFGPAPLPTAYFAKSALNSMRGAARGAYRRAQLELPVETKGVAAVEAEDASREDERRLQLRKLYRDLLGALPKQERLIIRMLYSRGLRPSAVAEKCGIDPATVTRIHQRALKLMASRLASIEKS